MATVIAERMMSPAQAARVVGVAPQTLVARANAGTLPTVKIGGKRFFDIDDIAAAAEAQRQAEKAGEK